jgi:hypothetical protein
MNDHSSSLESILEDRAGKPAAFDEMFEESRVRPA